MKLKPIVFCSLVLPLAAHAYDYQPFSYNFVDATYWDQSSDAVEGDGYSVSGSFELKESAFVTVGYSEGTVDEILGVSLSSVDADIDYEGITIGFGGYGQVNERLSTWGGLSITRESYEGRIGSLTGDLDADTIRFGGGLRLWAFPKVELNTQIYYVYTDSDDLDVSENDYSLGIGARFYLVGGLSLGVHASRLFDAESDQVAASIRYDF